MNDTELYEFFKSKGEAFNEMPSAELWQKITLSLDKAPQKAISKSFIAKLFLMIAVIIGSSYGLLTNENDPVIEVTKPEIKVMPSLIKDTLPREKAKNKEISGKVMQFKKLSEPQPAIVQPKPMPFRRITVITDSSVASQPEKPIGTVTEAIPDGRILFANRITIRSTEKLTKKGFDSLVNQSLLANKEAYGKLLVVKAIGHKPFSKIITPIEKTEIIHFKTDSIFKKPTKTEKK